MRTRWEQIGDVSSSVQGGAGVIGEEACLEQGNALEVDIEADFDGLVVASDGLARWADQRTLDNEAGPRRLPPVAGKEMSDGPEASIVRDLEIAAVIQGDGGALQRRARPDELSRSAISCD